MELLTIDEACEVSGVNSQTLRNWISSDLIQPARAGTTGTGKGHRLSTVQVFALAAGSRHRDEGASSGRVTGVVRFLAGLTLEKLEVDIEAGRTFVVPASMLDGTWLPGLLIEPPLSDPSLTKGALALMRRLDLKAILVSVRKGCGEVLARRTAKRGRGKKRKKCAKQ